MIICDKKKTDKPNCSNSSIQSSPISSLSSNLPTMTSLLSSRLVKRTSVDSGINLDFPIPSFRSTLWGRSRNFLNQSPLPATATGLDIGDSFLFCKLKNYIKINFVSSEFYFVF